MWDAAPVLSIALGFGLPSEDAVRGMRQTGCVVPERN